MARVKVNFTVEIECHDDKRNSLDRWECRTALDMELSERPRVGENWKFYSARNHEDLFSDYSKVTGVYIHPNAENGIYVDVMLDALSYNDPDISVIKDFQESPEWKVFRFGEKSAPKPFQVNWTVLIQNSTRNMRPIFELLSKTNTTRFTESQVKSVMPPGKWFWQSVSAQNTEWKDARVPYKLATIRRQNRKQGVESMFEIQSRTDFTVKKQKIRS